MKNKYAAPGDGHSHEMRTEYWRDSARLALRIEALLIALGWLATTFAGVDDNDRAGVQTGVFFYAALVATLQLADYRGGSSRGLVILQTWGMAVVIAWLMWFTDRLGSPMRNAFLLAILTSAITVGMLNTMALVCFIAIYMAVLSSVAGIGEVWSLPFLGDWVTRMTPLVIVAYVTAQFGSDLRYGMSKSRLAMEVDKPSGLPNARGFIMAAHKALGRAARDEQAVCMVVVSTDHDDVRTGRGRGGKTQLDGLVPALAKEVAGVLRYGDIIGRIAADRLAILLVDATRERCDNVVDAILATTVVAAQQVSRGTAVDQGAAPMLRVGTAGPIAGVWHVHELLVSAEADLGGKD